MNIVDSFGNVAEVTAKAVGLSVGKLEAYALVAVLCLASAFAAYHWAYSRGFDAAETKWEAASLKAEAARSATQDRLTADAARDNALIAGQVTALKSSVDALRYKASQPIKVEAVFPPGCVVSQQVVQEANNAALH